jgi:hypothetical protein
MNERPTIQDIIDTILAEIPGAPPGMDYLVSWLGDRVDGVEITDVPVGDAFQTQ